jgi:hypothetical protein
MIMVELTVDEAMGRLHRWRGAIADDLFFGHTKKVS